MRRLFLAGMIFWASAGWAQDAADDAGPKPRLAIKETQRTPSPKGTKLQYEFAASGFPLGKTYTFWIEQSGDYRKIPLQTGYLADVDGKLVCPDAPAADASPKARPHCLTIDQFKLDIHDYHKAEPVRFMVTSTDGAVNAVAVTYPFPVQAEDGPCKLNVSLGNTKFTQYAVEATGFPPNEPVTISSTAWKDSTPRTVQVSAKGNFADLSVANGKSGTATFTAVGKSCHVAVTYDWGKAAMAVQ